MAWVPDTTKNSEKDISIEFFPHQVAGHVDQIKLIQTREGIPHLVKFCSLLEATFYKDAQNRPNLLKFLPEYYGEMDLQSLRYTTTILESEESESNFKSTLGILGNNLLTGVRMENLLREYKYPSIIDIKLGTQLYGNDADDQKKKKMMKQAEITTSGKTGLRICGMKVYSIESDEYIVYGKEYGRGLTEDTLIEGFRDFILTGTHPNRRKKTIQIFIQRLNDLKMVLKKEDLRLFGSSLLLIYESYGPNSMDISKNNSNSDSNSIEPIFVSVKLIDFAHSIIQPGLGPDNGCLLGIENLIRLLSEIS